jgi:uncharacterized membrane protein
LQALIWNCNAVRQKPAAAGGNAGRHYILEEFQISNAGGPMISIAMIHPMLVHFPIVFLISAVVLDLIVLITQKDFGSRQGLPLIAVAALLLGTLSAVAAAIFGDMAADKAIAAGFPAGPIEVHETFAIITICIFGLYSLWRLLVLWRGYSLRGFTSWVSAVPGMIGLVLLIFTAYYGGELVYHFGVNVAPVIAK